MDGLREEVHKMRLHVCDCKRVQTETDSVNKGRMLDIKREVQKSEWEKGGGIE